MLRIAVLAVLALSGVVGAFATITRMPEAVVLGRDAARAGLIFLSVIRYGIGCFPG
jgi:hypothetical protein